MKTCEACHVQVYAQKRCPLCQGVLVGEASDKHTLYPSYLKQRRRRLLWRFIAMAVVLVCAISVLFFLNNPGEHTGTIVAFIVAGGVCVLLEMLLLLTMRGSFARIVSDQALLLSVLCVLWDVATGWNGWALHYVVPLLLLAALTAIQIVRLACRQVFSDYGLRLLLMALLCIVMPQFIKGSWAGLACAIGGMVSLVLLLFLEGRRLRSELFRRFHL